MTAKVLVIGGGASGLMCAISAASRGHKVLVLEKNAKVGLKILVSGGGRCNFTNLYADPREHYLSDNPNFCISAMRRYLPSDFIDRVEQAGIAYHEKKLGQLFCDDSARDIVTMLLEECQASGVDIRVGQAVSRISPKPGGGFTVSTADRSYDAQQVVLASGGLSMPKIASDLAFRTAKDLKLRVVPPRAALVPLTWNAGDKERYAALSGISVDARVQIGDAVFRENILFAHRGLSGPAMLQISSYWREGEGVEINLLPDLDVGEWLVEQRQAHPQQLLSTVLKRVLPKRLVAVIDGFWFQGGVIGELSSEQLQEVGRALNGWQFCPGGSEGYRTAEVTLGGIDTRELSSKTFAVEKVPGLYAVGEALDVTGWLGGYNFQWAWASGWCCGQHL